MNEDKLPDYEALFEKEGNGKKKNNKFIQKLLLRDWKKLLVSTFFYLIKNSPVWIVPILTSDIINLITDQPEKLYLRLAIDGILMFLIIAQNCFTHVWYANIVDKMTRDTANGVRLTVVRKLQHLSITYHKEMESGTIQSKFLSDIDKINTYYSTILKVLIPGIIGLVVACGISLYKSPIVTLFFLLVVPLNIISSQIYKTRMRKNNRSFRVENEAMASRITNMLQMMTLIKAHGLETVETIETKKVIDKVTNEGLKVDNDFARFGSLSWVVSEVLAAGALIFTGVLAIKGQITIGDVVLFQSLFRSINSSISTLLNAYPSIISGNESIYSVSEIITNEELESATGKLEPRHVDGNVDFNHVWYHYPDSEEYQIKDVDLHVKQGECIAFVGSSGGGKSTMMNLLLGLVDPSKGSVCIDGVNMMDLSKATFRHFVSVVPQNCILFPGTIRDNITYGLEKFNEEDLDEVVKASNVEEFLPSMRFGIDTVVGEHGDKLSGGQKQRVSIARALIRKPKILILDEATSALDNTSEYHIGKAIETITKTCTTFIVAHRLSTIRNADRIVVLENGEMVEVGTYDELIAKKGRFYELDKLSRLKESI